MSNFSPTKCYDLTKCKVEFDKTGIRILDSGKLVDSRSYKDGFDIMVHDGDFCFGEITFGDHFMNTVDLKDPKACIQFQAATMRIIGADTCGDPGIAAHLYKINTCPVRIAEDAHGLIAIKCPCDKGGANCSNQCYEFAPWN